MGKTFGFIVEKGGVAKTTSAVTIAHILSVSGYKILIVDMDKQGDATKIMIEELDYKPVDHDKLLCNLISADDVRNFIQESNYENIDCIPASFFMKDVKRKIAILQEQDSSILLCLQKNLAKIKDDYDYIIIDCNPGDDLLIEPCICACDFIVTPARPDSSSFDGVRNVLSTTNELALKYKLPVKFKGAFFTMVPPRMSDFEELESTYISSLGEYYIPTKIKQAVQYTKANLRNVPITKLDKQHSSVDDYIELAKALELFDEEHYTNLTLYRNKRKVK